MRIVTRDAPQISIAATEAAAGVHLLHLADGFGVAGQSGRLHEDGPILLERQARPIIGRLTSPSENAIFPYQVALLADGLAQSRRQPGRVHDRVIHALIRASPFLLFNVQLPRSVTTFAAN